MAKIAVDIVLLPSDEMMDEAIKVNRKLLEKIILSKEDCLPHISLAMGVINKKDIPSINKDLQEIARQFSLINLDAINISTHKSASGETVSCFTIKNTKELQLLHEKVIGKMSQYFTYDAAEDMLYSPAGIEKSTLQWINNYPKNSSFENFSPHITIGFGEVSDVNLPIRFTASKLALCHLGNYCTCRKILASADLKNG